MTRLLIALQRKLRALGRPSATENRRHLMERGEKAEDFVIREARVEDLTALARVHVTAWNATHGRWRGTHPSYELRRSQWKEKLASRPHGWFCYVAESPNGAIVGFATGQGYAHGDLPDYDAQLAQIYLLGEYQRVGLGSRLFHAVAQRHVEAGRRAMVLFSQPDNPSCAFFEALGGERLLTATGTFDGGYGWRALAAFGVSARDTSGGQGSRAEGLHMPRPKPRIADP